MDNLYLPPEDAGPKERLVPFGQWRNGQVYVRSWRKISDNLFLLDFTNSKSGKSSSWRTAIVKSGFRKDYKQLPNSTDWGYVDNEETTWIAVAEAKKAKVAGQDFFRASVYPVFDGNDYYYPWTSQLPAKTLEIATQRMIALVLQIHGEHHEQPHPQVPVLPLGEFETGAA